MATAALYLATCSQFTSAALIYSSYLNEMVDTDLFEQEAATAKIPNPNESWQEIENYGKLLKTFVDAFEGYDTDENGVMTFDEFYGLSVTYFPLPDAKKVEQVARARFQSFDLDKDQELTFTEFAQLTSGMPLDHSFNKGMLAGPKPLDHFSAVGGAAEVPCTGAGFKEPPPKKPEPPPQMSDIRDFSGWKVVIPPERMEAYKATMEDPTIDIPNEYYLPPGSVPVPVSVVQMRS
eukprot:gb/GEZN01013310.1/.p1 GENE.gb/GEZN01013310.1/~~gb/GEZN01013310.1/.p1  ORF type:complete len:251 (+),score=36.70 gb/GEZN01013310.1/:50-754(+)